MINVALKSRIIELYESQVKFSFKIGTSELNVSRVICGRFDLPEAEKKRWARMLKSKVEDIFPDAQCPVVM